MSGHRYQDGAIPPSPSTATTPFETHQLPALGHHNYPPAEGLESPTSPVGAYGKPDGKGYQPVVSSSYAGGNNPRAGRQSSYGFTAPPSSHPLSNETYADASTLKGSQEDLKSSKASFLRNGGASFKQFGTGSSTTRDSALEPTRRTRLGYIDGLRFIAAWVILNGTLLDNVIPSDSYSAIQRSSPLYIFRSTNLGFTALLILSGRAILHNLWDVPSAHDDASKGPSVAWFKLSRSLVTRPFRFILPVLVVAAIQWALGATGATDVSSDIALEAPRWDQIRSWSGYCTLVFDLFSQWFVVDTTTAKAFGSNLWFTPWIFDSSYCAYVTHIMLGNLSSNRYYVYFLLGFFSWCSFNFFAVTTMGVVICDLAVHGQFEKVQKWPFLSRLALQLTLVAIALVFQWINVIRDNVNSGLATISVLNLTEVTFCDFIFVSCALVVVETSTWCQFVFGNWIVKNTVGRLSAGMVVLSPIILYTVIPRVASSMNASGTVGSSVLGVSWLVLFLVTVALSVVFHFVVEWPSKYAGEWFGNYCTNWGRSDEEEAARKAMNAKANEGVKAPNSAPARLKAWFL